MTKVSWNHDVPQEIRDSILPHIRRWEHLVPTWIHDLRVAWEPEGVYSMLNSSYHEYRYARITVCGNWLTAAYDERDDAVRHELLHITLHPMTDWTKDLIERLGDGDERLQGWLLSEWQERLEAAVCDLEHATREFAREA